MLVEKNNAALRRWGARKILGDLANVPPSGASTAAEEFVDQYGLLITRVQDPAWTFPELSDVIEYARRFRLAWSAKTKQQIQAVNASLDAIFAAGDPIKAERPVLRANFDAGKWEPEPRSLLDVLAVELMRSRKMLHRCERPECKRYFVKDFSRDKYCSIRCSDEMRRIGQIQWAREHRDELSQRRKRRKK